MSVGLGRAVFDDTLRRRCEESRLVNQRFGSLSEELKVGGCEGGREGM